MVVQGFEVLAVFTIWVKVRAGLSDILHHAVGEMPGRAEGVSCQRGFVGTVDLGYKRLPGNLPVPQSPPLLVASSSRPPVDASGGQEKWGYSHLTNRGSRLRPRGHVRSAPSDESSTYPRICRIPSRSVLGTQDLLVNWYRFGCRGILGS